MFYIALRRPIKSGVQIVSIEDRNGYKKIEENVRKLTSIIMPKLRADQLIAINVNELD
jgi:hypothetical protein